MSTAFSQLVVATLRKVRFVLAWLGVALAGLVLGTILEKISRPICALD